MKAITLVNDMPSKCHGCPYDDFDFRCKLTGFNHKDYVMRGTRDIRCPLKPMPEPKYAKATDDDVKWGECIGWNACLEELEK